MKRERAALIGHCIAAKVDHRLREARYMKVLKQLKFSSSSTASMNIPTTEAEVETFRAGLIFVEAGDIAKSNILNRCESIEIS